jgi:hypothetical protein
VFSITHAHALKGSGTRAGLKIAGGIEAVSIYRGRVAACAGNGRDEGPNYRGFHIYLGILTITEYEED